MTDKKKVRVAFLDLDATGIGPNGRGVPVASGQYRVAELDSMEDGVLMLECPSDGSLLAMVPTWAVDHTQEVLDGEHALAWAAYYRANPQVVATWGEQNGRPPR